MMTQEVDFTQAHGELMKKVFGRIPSYEELPNLEVSRSKYTKAMKAVQRKYGLKQGHPQFLEWVLTCVGRSPVIIEDEGAGEDGKTED